MFYIADNIEINPEEILWGADSIVIEWILNVYGECVNRKIILKLPSRNTQVAD
jgi:hypothetical protein